MEIKLDPARRPRAISTLRAHFAREFDEPLSEFRAEGIIDLLFGALGPDIYNQAVQDVRAHLQSKLDDLDGEVFAEVR